MQMELEEKTTPRYNLWYIRDMLNMATSSFDSVKVSGAIILVTVQFDCDFDHSVSECTPTFNFQRIDAVTELSPGYNFRYSSYYWNNDDTNEGGPRPGYREYRDLMKVYGIRVIYMISGKGSKFDIKPLVLNLASGLALLGIATITSDFLALYVMPHKKLYNEAKFEDVETNGTGESEALLGNTGFIVSR